MSPKVSVRSLRDLCLINVANRCIQALSDEEGKHCGVVGEYLSNTTGEILEGLLKNILNKADLDASTRYSCLEVLLREDVKMLDTKIFPRFYYEKILKVISSKGRRLRHLNLKGVWVRDYPQLLRDVLCTLQNLTSLIIPHMANDNVIEAILHLKNLIVLDISGEACYTVKGIRRFKSDTLRVLEVGNYGKVDLCQDEENSGSELVAEILENLPNLTSLKVYSFTGSAIHVLYNKDSSTKTKLNYLHDTGTTIEVIRALQELAPDLISVHLDSPQIGVTEELCRFRKLCKVKLTKADGEAVLNYLTVAGEQLQTLTLNHNKTFSLDLSQICLTAPNLINLELFQMKLTHSNVDTYFMYLQTVEVLYGDTSDATIRYILTNAPFLKRIVVGCLVTMTDGDIFRLCAHCDFASLEELWFSYARGLTATSVELLMGHCPNLRVLGQLGEWDIHPEELDYLRSVVASTNADLELLASGVHPLVY